MKILSGANNNSFKLVESNGNEVKVVTTYLQFLSAKNYSPNTIKNYAYDLKYFFGYLNLIQTDYLDIRPQKLVDFVNSLHNQKRVKK